MAVSFARSIAGLRLDGSGAVLPYEAGDWALEPLAGRLVQLEGAGDSAAITLAFSLILDAQRAGEPAVWVSRGEARAERSVFYPPDAYDNGVDLAALPVVRVPDITAVLSASDLLLRSGGFGLIVADLGAAAVSPATVKLTPAVPSTALARLAGLARRHQTATVFLTSGTEMSRGSLGSLISVHALAQRRRIGADRFDCGIVAVKDKLRGPAWRHVEVRRGASGLR